MYYQLVRQLLISRITHQIDYLSSPAIISFFGFPYIAFYRNSGDQFIQIIRIIQFKQGQKSIEHGNYRKNRNQICKYQPGNPEWLNKWCADDNSQWYKYGHTHNLPQTVVIAFQYCSRISTISYLVQIIFLDCALKTNQQCLYSLQFYFYQTSYPLSPYNLEALPYG